MKIRRGQLEGEIYGACGGTLRLDPGGLKPSVRIEAPLELERKGRQLREYTHVKITGEIVYYNKIPITIRAKSIEEVSNGGV